MNITNNNLNGVRIFFYLALSATFGLTVFPAAYVNAASKERHPRLRQVNRRVENQQDRIAHGINSGQLTPREAANLELKTTSLKNEERTFRVENNGHLTRAEQMQLNRQENRLSTEIYSQKHDAQSLGFPHSEIGARQDVQQLRIGQGIQSGKLTPAEATRLEARETALRNQIATDRNTNGGKLTATERQQINQELNQLSASIEKEKQDAQTQPH